MFATARPHAVAMAKTVRSLRGVTTTSGCIKGSEGIGDLCPERGGDEHQLAIALNDISPSQSCVHEVAHVGGAAIHGSPLLSLLAGSLRRPSPALCVYCELPRRQS